MIGVEVVAQPDEGHSCTLPTKDEFTGVRGTVAVCQVCGLGWVYLPIPWERTWVRVRWWHRQAHELLRAVGWRPVGGGVWTRSPR